jgi:hypothetical protein
MFKSTLPQSFNCVGSSDENKVYFEQFVRQSMDMKSKPIIIFTSSETPNWDKKVCDNNPQRPEMSAKDKALLKFYDSGKNIKKLAEKKKAGISGQFSVLLEMFQSYKMSGTTLKSHLSNLSISHLTLHALYTPLQASSCGAIQITKRTSVTDRM